MAAQPPDGPGLICISTPLMLLSKRQREEQETEEQTPQQGDDLIAECAEQALASDFRLH